MIAIGCTGGRHRSVAIAEHLAARYREQRRPRRGGRPSRHRQGPARRLSRGSRGAPRGPLDGGAARRPLIASARARRATGAALRSPTARHRSFSLQEAMNARTRRDQRLRPHRPERVPRRQGPRRGLGEQIEWVAVNDLTDSRDARAPAQVRLDPRPLPRHGASDGERRDRGRRRRAEGARRARPRRRCRGASSASTW